MANYITGTYGLKYYKSITNERGVVVRLEIHQRGYTGTNYEIADLQGLALQIQGAQDSITAPIIKTSLRLGLLDNPHAPGAVNGIADGRKCANWQEFYTPDATLYLVKLLRDGVLFWSGYITPDSYTESLDAFGTVNITVRDNLGHLQDFEFDMTGDANGLVRVGDVIVAACQKIALPLDLTYPYNDCPVLGAADGSCTVEDLYVCASALEGKDWYEALEAVLDSTGWAMRFVGYNVLFCAPLRLLDTFGNRYSDAPAIENADFLGRHSGTRTYDPAWRRITETADFKLEADLTLDVDAAKSGTKTTTVTRFAAEYGDISIGRRDAYGPVVSTSAGGTLGGWQDLPKTWILDDAAYPLSPETENTEGSAAKNYLYLAANVGVVSGSAIVWATNVEHHFARTVRTPGVAVKLEFAAAPGGCTDGQIYVLSTGRLKDVVYSSAYTNASGGTTMYWNGEAWQTGRVDLSQTFDTAKENVTTLEVDLSDCELLGLYGKLDFVIRQMHYFFGGTPATLPDGIYARLKNVTFSSNVQRRMRSNKVTTIVDDAHNVLAERKPEFNVMPQTVDFVLPQNYESAFYYYDMDGHPQLAPWLWQWSDDTAALPFPVKVHQQLLMFHLTTEEILEGAARPRDYTQGGTPTTLHYSVVNYKNIQHMVLSLTHDMLTDRWTSAILRSWEPYGEVWDGSETRGDDGTIA